MHTIGRMSARLLARTSLHARRREMAPVHLPRVLLVDNDRDLVELATEALGDLPVAVDRAYDGTQAIAAARSAPFDLLVTELRLPDISGLDTVRQLQAARIQLPFIVVSGHMTVALTVEAMILGALTVLEKPFGVAALIGAVREALPREAADAQAMGDVPAPGPEAARRAAQAVDLAVRETLARGYESAEERLARYMVSVVTCAHDPRTTADWAGYINIGASTVRDQCRLAGLQAHAARDLARVLRAILWSDAEWSPEAVFDCADARTLHKLIAHAGLENRTGGPTPTVDELLDRQLWLPQDHPALAALRALLHRV